MKRIAGMALLLAVMLPDAADAQHRSSRYNEFGFAPYVGVYKDAYDAAADGSDLGWMLGFRAEYHESSRLTLHANFAYAESNDVGDRPLSANFVIADNHWVMLTGGASFALVPGPTSVAVGADAGIAWRQRTVDAPGTTHDDGWRGHEVIVPTLTVRHQFTPRTSINASMQDYILNVLEGGVRHSPALTLGLSFR